MGSADMSDGRSANFTLRQGEVIYSTGGCSVFGVFEEACGSAVGVRKDFGMNVSLVLVQTDGKQREVPIKKSVQVIGRQTDCQIRIPSANVSRHHCEVSASDDGHITVRDLGSSNGTFVNKQKVTQASVNAGDLLSLGGFVFVVKVDGKPSFIDSDDVIEDGLVEAGGSSSVPESRPTAATLMAPPPPRGPVSQKPSGKQSKAAKDPDDSSVVDFDFLDDDDDLKKQPKL